ncbi:MAG: hypothetical protein NWR74_06260, partial [Burkholderiaceae bacterium]|nr:hypothetical protein [Burkholderiaceae bacterium]
VNGPYRYGADETGPNGVPDGIPDLIDESAIGVEVTDVDLGLAIMTPTLLTALPGLDQYAPQFISAKASVASASLVGIDPSFLDVGAQDVEVNINTFVIPKAPAPVNAALQLFGPPSINYQLSPSFRNYTEDEDGDGLLFTGEDSNGNLKLDAGEDLNFDGLLQLSEDRNNNGVIDSAGFMVAAGGNNGVFLDFAEEVIQAEIGYADINLAGFMQMSASMAMTKKGSETVTLSNGEETIVTSLAIGINDANAFLGMPAKVEGQSGAYLKSDDLLTQLYTVEDEDLGYYRDEAGQRVNSDGFLLSSDGSRIASVQGYFYDSNADGRIDEDDAVNENAIGIVIEDLDVGLIVGKELVISAEGVDIGAYMAGRATVDYMGLNGVPGVTMQAEEMAIEINTGARFSLGVDQFEQDPNTGRVRYDPNLDVNVSLTTIDFSQSTWQDTSLTVNQDSDLSNDIVNAGYAIATGNPSEPIVLDYSGQFFRLFGKAEVDLFGLVSMNGVMDFRLDETDGLTAFADVNVQIGPDDFNLTQEATGLLVINDGGVALRMDLSQSLELGPVVDLNADLQLTLNTFGKEITYVVPETFRDSTGFDTFSIGAYPPGKDASWTGMYLALTGAGNLDLFNGALDLKGDFALIVAQSGSKVTMELGVTAVLDLPVLEPLGVTGTLGLVVDASPRGNETGLYGSLEVGAANSDSTIIDGGGIFSVKGRFLFQINTTSVSQKVRGRDPETGTFYDKEGAAVEVALQPYMLRIAGQASIEVGPIELKGAVDLLIDSNGVQAALDVTLDLGDFGEIGFTGAAAFGMDTRGKAFFAMYASMNVNMGVSIMNIKASATVQINTSSVAYTTLPVNGVSHTIAANTLFNMGLDGQLKVLAFNVDFSGNLSIVKNVFKLEFSGKLNFFNVLNVNVAGYLDSAGNFDLTGGVSVHIPLGPLKINGGMSLHFSSQPSFGASIWGSIDVSVTIKIGGGKVFGIKIPSYSKTFSARLAGFSGSFELSPSYASMRATVTFMGIKISGSQSWSFGDPPVISYRDGGTLYLNMGDKSGRYGSGKLYDDLINESYSIEQSGGTITVSSMGEKKTYSASQVTRIVANGGKGNDTIYVGENVSARLDFDGGLGSDTFIIYGGAAGSSIRGGAGNDVFVGGVRSGLTFSGGDGNDTFKGGEGAEIIDMGAGANTISAGGGADTITVSGTSDTVDGGRGDDVIYASLAGYANVVGGDGYDRLILSPFISSEPIEFNDHELVVKTNGSRREIDFNDSLDVIKLTDSAAQTTISSAANASWGSTGMSLDAAGVLDVTNAHLVGPLATFNIAASGIHGTLNTELAGLTVQNRGTAGVSGDEDIIVREANNLNIVDGSRANGGLYAAKGSIDIALAALEARLSLTSGVIATASGGSIDLRADDMDFASGANSVSGSGALVIRTMTDAQGYRIGGAAQSPLGVDYSTEGNTGFLDLGARDMSALADGFSSITIGHAHAGSVMRVGDLENAAVGGSVFSARLDDTTTFLADRIEIVGDVQSSTLLTLEARILEVQRQNQNAPAGAPDAGLTASSIVARVTEQMLVSGWVIADNLIDIDVTASTGVAGLVTYGDEINSLTADQGATLQTLASDSVLRIATSGSIYSAAGMYAGVNQGTGASIAVDAGTGLTLLQGGTFATRYDNGSITLRAGSASNADGYIHLMGGSAVVSGATLDAGNDYQLTGSGSTLNLSTPGEMMLAGSLTAAGNMSLSASEVTNPNSSYFNSLNGSVLTQETRSVEVAAILAGLNAGPAGPVAADALKALFTGGSLSLETGTSVLTAVANYLPFGDLPEATRLQIAAAQGYQVFTEGGYFNPSTGRFFTTIGDGPVVAYSVDDPRINWGVDGKPAAGSAFTALTPEQQDAIGMALGYTRYEGTVYFNRFAEQGDEVVIGFLEGAQPDYNNALIDWVSAGVPTPAMDANFDDDLTSAQKLVVANTLDYHFDYNLIPVADWSAEPFDFSSVSLDEWRDGSTLEYGMVISDAQWGEVEKPSTGTLYADLSDAQKQIVDSLVAFVPAQTDRLTLSGEFVAGDVVSVVIDGVTYSYTVLDADIGETDAATIDAVAYALALSINDGQDAVNAQSSTTTTLDFSTQSQTTEDGSAISSITVNQLAAAGINIVSTDERLVVDGSQLTLSGTFDVDDLLSLDINDIEVLYTVRAEDIGATDAETQAQVAESLASALALASPSESVTQISVRAAPGAQVFVLSVSDEKIAVEHNPLNALTGDQLAVVVAKLMPLSETPYWDLSDDQKAVVVNALDAIKTAGEEISFFSATAPTGKNLVVRDLTQVGQERTFTQGVTPDYRNDNIYWGDVGEPAAGTVFNDLTDAQKEVVARSLGYERFDGVHFFNAQAPLSEVWVSGFAEGGGAYDLSTMDWGGVPAPALNTTFEQLSVAQRAVVASELGFNAVDQEVYVKFNADQSISVKASLVEGVGGDYDATQLDWGIMPVGEPGAAWADLSSAQQDQVLSELDYTRWSGLVYFNASAANSYRVGFVEGSSTDADYANSEITWNALTDGIASAGTPFDALSTQQQSVVLQQAGLLAYTGTVYYNAGASVGKQLLSALTVDYAAAGAPSTPTKRWLLSDGDNNQYLIYANDSDNDGTTDAIEVMEVPVLLGQRGAGFLLTGSITTLQADSDFIVDVVGDAIVSGGVIDLQGAGSDLSITSERSVYWQGQASINGNITLVGEGAQGADMPLDGVSVYVHGSSTLSSNAAGSSVTIDGAQDVEIHGAILAGAIRGNTGTTYLGPDSTIAITAGQQILLNNSLAAAKSVTLRTTGVPGSDDNYTSVYLDTAAGITAAGWTSDLSGGLVDIAVDGDVVLGGMVLSGGSVVQTFDAGVLTGESITWSNELSRVDIQTVGKLDLGVDTLALSGATVEVGARIHASQSIKLSGGVSSDQIGLNVAGAAVVAVSNPAGVIQLSSAQDALILGQVVAGGAVSDHYDSVGGYLGSTVQNSAGDSEIYVSASGQIRVGRDLMAGKLIDVQGGVSPHIATDADPWADQGIVIGGGVQLKTWQEDSNITLSADGDLAVLTPSWTHEIVADGFVEFADGHFSAPLTGFKLTVEEGTVDRSLDIQLDGVRTSSAGGINAVVADLQAQISAFFGSKVNVALTDGRLMLTSFYEMRIEETDFLGVDGGAERLGFTQIKALSPTAGATTSSRTYAVDASGQGSVVNLGSAAAPAGAISIAGAIRGYSAVNLYAGTGVTGNQAVTFEGTSLIETLSGSMVFNLSGDTTMQGDFIARGDGASIIINSSGTLALKGSLTAQRDILIGAGSNVVAGEVSLLTDGTATFNTLDAGSQIVLFGVNDVVIDSNVGRGSAGLELIQASSATGTLTLMEASGWLESDNLIVLSGQHVDVAGVLRNNQATAADDDFELIISAVDDVYLHGAIGIVGSMFIEAGDDIEVANMALSAQSSGASLVLVAGDAVTMGGDAPTIASIEGESTAVIAEAHTLLSVSAGGSLRLSDDAQLMSTGDGSAIELQAQRISVLGQVRAGADSAFAYDPTSEVMSFNPGALPTYTGKAASLNVFAVDEVTLGDLSGSSETGGVLFATGSLNVQSGSNVDGVGYEMSRHSQAKVDASGYGTWSDTTVDASRWQIVDGVTYTVRIGQIDFSSSADSDSTINTVLNDLRGKIDAHASFAAIRSGDVLTLTTGDKTLLSDVVTTMTSTVPDAGTAAVVLGNDSVGAKTDATVDTSLWNVVAGARYSVTIDTKTYAVTAGKDYTRAMVNEELVRLIKEGLFYTASLSGNVLTVQNAGPTTGEEDDTRYVGALSAGADATAGVASVVAGNVDLLVDGELNITSDGDIVLLGGVSATDVGADISIQSRSQIYIDALVSAQETLRLRAGIDNSRVGVWVTEVLLDDNGDYESGGTLDTDSGGVIDIESVDGVTIKGVLGQREITDGDLGGAKVGDISIVSLSGDVNLMRNTNVRDALNVSGDSVGILSGSYVYATGRESELYLEARDGLVLSGRAVAAGLDAAIAKASRLVHMVAPTMSINGTIDITSLTGRALLSGGDAIAIGGTIVSRGNIDVHAGVDMAWTRQQMEASLTRADLDGGTITIAGQGLLQAVGTVTLLAGADVTLDADANVASVESVLVPTYVTVEKETQVVVGSIKVASGIELVPEITIVPTEVTEQVGTDKVQIGSSYETMDVSLTQIGYYNPNAADSSKFVETLIEGVHYLNSTTRSAQIKGVTIVDWTKAGDEQTPTRQAESVTGDPESTAYKGFAQLSDAQRWAVLNATGYMPVYEFDYTNYQLNQTINGTASVLTQDDGTYPDWNPTGDISDTTKQVYYVDLANWRDKYILMPVGAQASLLSAASSGEAKYLTDTTLNGQSDGVWATLNVDATPTGEYLGFVQEGATVNYYKPASAASWSVGYASAGSQNYTLTNGLGVSNGTFTEGAFKTYPQLSQAPSFAQGSQSQKTATDSAGRSIIGASALVDALGTGTTLQTSSKPGYTKFSYQVPSFSKVRYGPFKIFTKWKVSWHTVSTVVKVSDSLTMQWASPKASPTKVYDPRVQLTYSVSTQTENLYNYRPVYMTSIKDVEVVNLKPVTIWKDEPVYETRVELVTDVRYDVATGRSNFGTADSVTAGNIIVDVGGSVLISGKMTASDDMSVVAAGAFTLAGQAQTGADGLLKPIASKLTGNEITVTAGGSLLLDDSASLLASQGVAQSAASLTLNAAADLSLGGRTGSASETTFDSVTLNADQDIYLSGSIDANSIAVSAGLAAGDGDIHADSDVRLSALAGDVVLTAGQYGGDISMHSATLEATGAVALSALSGAVVQSKLTNVSAVSAGDQIISGLVRANSLAVEAGNAITLKTAALTVDRLLLSSAGNIEIVNTGDMLVTEVQAADGAITIHNYGELVVLAASTLGRSDANDIRLVTANLPGAATAALNDLSVGDIQTVQRGDVTLYAQGAVAQRAGTRVVADVLDVRASLLGLTPAAGQAWLVDLATQVNTLQVNTSGAGDVRVNQDENASLATARDVVVSNTRIGDGDLVIEAAGSVDVASVVLASNSSDNSLNVTAAGDIVVRYADVGIYLETAADAPQNDLNGDGDFDDADETLTEASSAGGITLNAGGSISEGGADDGVDLVANLLTLTAGTGITGLEVAINALDAQTTVGDIDLSDFDGALEKASGLEVKRAQTAKSAVANTLNSTVDLTAQGTLRVGSEGLVSGDMLRLTSVSGSVTVAKPLAWSDATPTANNSLDHNGGIALVAAQNVQLYQFVSGAVWTEYRAGDAFSFGVADYVTVNNVLQVAGPGTLTETLPTVLSADTLILETGGTLSFLDGVLTAGKKLELIAGENVYLGGTMTAGYGYSQIQALTVTAKGERQAQTVVNTNESAIVPKQSVAQDTGFINVQMDRLSSSNFALRAAQNIYLKLDSLTLSGFVGGLAGFDAAANIEMDILGTLTVNAGIVRADEAAGTIKLNAANIISNGASVFIGNNIDVTSASGIGLNTMTDHLTAVSTGRGDIVINESDDLIIDLVSAYDGAITIGTSGDTYVRDLHIDTDRIGNDIVLRAAGDVYIDSIESAVDAGAGKRNGNVTVEATGDFLEWEAPVYNVTASGVQQGVRYVVTDVGNTDFTALGASENVVGAVFDATAAGDENSGTGQARPTVPVDITGYAYDQRVADVYGYTVTLIGAPSSAVTPVLLESAADVGSGAELEVRVASNGSAINESAAWYVHGQVFGADGVAIGGMFDAVSAKGMDNPQLVQELVGGGFVLVRTTFTDGIGWDIYAQTFDAAGTALSDEFRVDSVTSSDEPLPMVQMLANGKFMVVWTSTDQQGYTDIYAQAFDELGAANGQDFMVNSTVNGDQDSQVVQTFGDGSFVVLWTSSDQSGNRDIYGQFFDKDGDAVGTEFGVYTQASGDNYEPVVKASDDTGFTVIWTSTDADELDIYGQRFGIPLLGTAGSEELISTLGNDILVGGAGDDVLHGAMNGLSRGYNLLIGGEGNDTLHGGVTDLAVFSGDYAGYEITATVDGFWQVKDTRTLDGDDGTDVLSGITTLQFADQSYEIGALITVGTADPDAMVANAVNGADGQDVFIGLGGDDVLNGGGGYDVAVYAGAFADYVIRATSAGWQVSDARGVAIDGTDLATDAVDLLIDVEALQFSDRTFELNATPIFADADGTFTGLTANDLVVFAGNAADYLVTATLDGDWQVTDTTTGVAADGSDRLSYVLVDVEGVQFADLSYQLPNSPLSGDDANNTIDTAQLELRRVAVSVVDGADRSDVVDVTVDPIGQISQSLQTLQPLSDGRFVVSWSTSASGVLTHHAQIYGADGTANTNVIDFTDPATFTVLSSGSVVATWAHDDSGTTDYLAQIFAADGASVGAQLSFSGTPVFTQLTRAGFVATWADAANGEGFMQIYAANGDAATTTSSYVSMPNATALSDGGFALRWAQPLAGGEPTTSAINYLQVFNTFSVGGTTTEITGELTALRDGGYVVTGLQSSAGTTSYPVQKYAANGTAVGALLAFDVQPSFVALNNGGLLATWSSSAAGSTTYFAQAFDALSVAVGGEHTFSFEPRFTALADGHFVAEWLDTSDGKHHVQAYGADAVAAGAVLDVGYAPNVTALVGGGFVADWHDTTQVLHYAQVVDSVGTAVGSPLVFDGAPDVLALAGGRFVTSWSADFAGYTHGYAQFYAADASIDGAQMTFIGAPVVSQLATGEVVVTGETVDRADDVLIGLGGDDTLIGGAGSDVAVFSGLSTDYLIAATPAGHWLVTDLLVADGDDGADTLIGIEALQFVDTTYHISLKPILGTAQNNVLTGFVNQDDVLVGGAGDDTLTGELGDVAVYAGNANGYRITATLDGNWQVKDTDATDGDDGVDKLIGITTLQFADLTYQISAGTTVGTRDASGNDVNDALTGSADNDFLIGLGGNDTLTGGAGYDVAVFAGNYAGYRITATLDGNWQVKDTYAADGDDGTDKLVGITRLQFADVDYQIVADMHLGDTDASSRLGGTGSDVFIGLGGNDTLTGADGYDVAVYAGNFADYRITATTDGNWQVRDLRSDSPEGTDKLIGIEALQFADSASGPNFTLLVTPTVDTLGTNAVTTTAGNDVLIGLGGDDALNGAGGYDVAVYAGDYADYRITVTTDGNWQVRDLRSGSPDGTDTLTGIEALQFADRADASFNPTFVLSTNIVLGNVSANTLDGGLGNDVLIGQGDDDLLNGGDDTVTGEIGYDVAVYSGGFADYRITATLDGYWQVLDLRANSPDGTDKLTGIEALQFTDQTYQIEANITLGTSAGTALSSALNAGVGNDVLIGLGGDDTLTGGAGHDTAVFAGNFANYLITPLADGNWQVRDLDATLDGADGTDKLIGIEALQFKDQAYTLLAAPVAVATDFDNLLKGSGSTDTLSGLGGNDVLIGGAGNDEINGGEGYDVAVFAGSFADYRITATLDGYWQVLDTNPSAGGDDGTDKLTGIEALQFADLTYTITANITLGTSASNALSSALNAGAGNDVLIGLAGNDTLTGGAGVDVAVFAGDAGQYLMRLNGDGNWQVIDNNTTDTTATYGFGDEGTDTLIGIEALQFANTTYTITAWPKYAQNNTLTGTSADELLVGGAGNDTIDGGAGNDLMVYSGNFADYSIRGLSNGYWEVKDSNALRDGTDQLIRVERLQFADSSYDFNSVLHVNTAGDDTITGVGSMDVVVYSGNYDQYTLAPRVDGSWQVQGPDGTDKLFSIEVLQFADQSYKPAAIYVGDEGANPLQATAEMQILLGLAGNDTLTGHDDNTIALYAGDYADYLISPLADGNWQVKDLRTNSPDGTDKLISIKTLQFNDLAYKITAVTTLGDSQNNALTGDSTRADVLIGGVGDDTLQGQQANDVAVFAGNYADYRITATLDGNWQVKDIDTTVDGNDGTDKVIGIKTLQFKDQAVDLS